MLIKWYHLEIVTVSYISAAQDLKALAKQCSGAESAAKPKAKAKCKPTAKGKAAVKAKAKAKGSAKRKAKAKAAGGKVTTKKANAESVVEAAEDGESEELRLMMRLWICA